MRKKNFSKIKSFLLHFPKILVSHFFLSSVFVLLIAFFLAAIFFLKYYFLEGRLSQPLKLKALGINEELLKRVSQEWQAREKLFQETDRLLFSDPFRGF